MKHSLRGLVSASKLLLTSSFKEVSKFPNRCNLGALNHGSLGVLHFQIGVHPANDAPHEPHRRWQSLVGSFRRQQGAAGAPGCRNTCPVGATFLSTGTTQLHASYRKGGHSIRSLRESLPADVREVHGAGIQPEPAENAAESPLVKGVLDRVSNSFPGEAPGVGTARIVKILLQLQLTEKDIESIFTRHRPLFYSAIAAKTINAAPVEELAHWLLAFGLTHREAGKAFKMVPHLLSTGDCQAWPEVIRYLRDELMAVRVSKVLSIYPTILEKAGMRNIVRLVRNHPSILRFSPKSLRKKAALLGRLLGQDKLGLLLDRCPSLLYVSSAVPAASFRWLADTLGEKEASRVVIHSPHLLGRCAEAHERNLSNLRATLPEVDVEALLVSTPGILATCPDSLRGAYEWLTGTFGQSTAAKVVLCHPRLLSVTVPSLQLMLDFVTGAMGRTAGDVAASPAVLLANLDTVLRPRFAALRAIGLAHRFSLYTVHMDSATRFQQSLDRPSTTSTGGSTTGRTARMAPLELPEASRGGLEGRTRAARCLPARRWQSGRGPSLAAYG
eukprot:jgi/Mesen1/7500/ME000039S06723